MAGYQLIDLIYLVKSKQDGFYTIYSKFKLKNKLIKKFYNIFKSF